MNLAFSTTFTKKPKTLLSQSPTLFVPKILLGIEQLQPDNENLFFYKQDYIFLQRKLKKDYKLDVNHPKIHTIRRDASNRWKTGNLIHFYIYTYTKNQFQFAPILKCVSTQKIDIVWHDADGFKCAIPNVYINNRWIVGEDLKQLALNDGFISVNDFFAYFNTDFTGKLIHWTNLKY